MPLRAYSFLVAVVFYCVAIRAQYLEIFESSIGGISISMVDNKDVDSVKTATIARFQQASFFNPSTRTSFADSFVSPVEQPFTCHRATIPFSAFSVSRRAFVFNSTHSTCELHRSDSIHGFVETSSGTVFCNRFSAFDHTENNVTYATGNVGLLINYFPIPLAFSRAKLESFPSVSWDSDQFTAMFTRHQFIGDVYAS